METRVSVGKVYGAEITGLSHPHFVFVSLDTEERAVIPIPKLIGKDKSGLRIGQEISVKILERSGDGIRAEQVRSRPAAVVAPIAKAAVKPFVGARPAGAFRTA